MDKLSSAVDFRPRSRQLYMGDMPWLPRITEKPAPNCEVVSVTTSIRDPLTESSWRNLGLKPKNLRTSSRPVRPMPKSSKK